MSRQKEATEIARHYCSRSDPLVLLVKTPMGMSVVIVGHHRRRRFDVTRTISWNYLSYTQWLPEQSAQLRFRLRDDSIVLVGRQSSQSVLASPAIPSAPSGL